MSEQAEKFFQGSSGSDPNLVNIWRVERLNSSMSTCSQNSGSVCMAAEEAEIHFLQTEADARDLNLNLVPNQTLMGLTNELSFFDLKGQGVLVDEVSAQKPIHIKSQPRIIIRDISQALV